MLTSPEFRKFTGLPHDIRLVNSIFDSIYPHVAEAHAFKVEEVHRRGVCHRVSALFQLEAEKPEVAGYTVDLFFYQTSGSRNHKFNVIDGIAGDRWVVDGTYGQFAEKPDPTLAKVLIARWSDLPQKLSGAGIRSDMHYIWTEAQLLFYSLKRPPVNR